MHGSYEALEGGLVQDALVDLTGGAGEEIDMRSAQAQIDLASGRLWSQLLRFKQEGFLLGAGSPTGSDVHISSSGIVQGHAYSLLQVSWNAIVLLSLAFYVVLDSTARNFCMVFILITILFRCERWMATSLFRYEIHGPMKLSGMAPGLTHHQNGPTG